MSRQDEPDELNETGQNGADGLAEESMRRVEAELASLSPRSVHLDRDRLMFLAGQASASGQAASAHRGWAWPAAFSAMSALAAGLLLTLVLRSPREVVRIVQVPVGNVQVVDDARAGSQQGRVSPSTEVSATERGSSAPEIAASARMIARGRPYVELRDRVLAMDLSANGLDRWPEEVARGEASSPPSPAAYHDLLESLLHGG
ncbi:MAG TPA: hypothetical protein VG826_21750 [Pirellulales bacterium]|nr:hypothetical protein [Pirellulales bacterium]